MKFLICHFLLVSVCFCEYANATVGYSKTFKVSQIQKEVATVLKSVTTDEGRGIYTKSRIGVAVKKTNEGYRLNFLVAAQENREFKNTKITRSRITISYQKIPHATFKWKLRKCIEDKFAEKLADLCGIYSVVSTLDTDKTGENYISSFKRVVCVVASEKEVIELVETYFSEFPANETLTVDLL